MSRMSQGRIEQFRAPRNCLDVLAQQIVACVAMDQWEVPALFDLVRGAYPFHSLSAEAFESVLRLVSGRFPTPEFRDLRGVLSGIEFITVLLLCRGLLSLPWSVAARFRIRVSFRSFWGTRALGSGSSTRSLSTSVESANRLCWVIPRGGSRRLKPIESWCPRPRGNPL